ncbi:MAG: hypothetical protein D4R65_15205 [Verrucomicrobiaceae bacterium]|nr:MAG: hypothetical protein D4R65_15205 [Verrucomicrobiaceae bacterium]
MTNFTWTRAGLPVAAALVAWGPMAGGFAAEVSPSAGSFQQIAARAVASAEKSQSMTVPGVDGWLFLDKELRHLIAPEFWASGEPQVPGDPLPAILDFKRQLDLAGIDLILVPVPAKATIYPDKLDASLDVPAPLSPQTGETDRAFYKALEENGIRVLDLTDPFLTARAEGLGPLYCRQDTHWAPEGIRIAAEEIAGRIKHLDWVAAQPKVLMKSESVPVTVKGDLAAALPGAKPEPDQVTARFVSAAGAPEKTPLAPLKGSPVILLGDSHNLIFHAGGDMQAAGAGLPDQLALELGFPVDVVAVRGSGATPARRNLARRKDNLAGCRIVVWCFSAREFTEGQGWAKVPVVKAPAQSGPKT